MSNEIKRNGSVRGLLYFFFDSSFSSSEDERTITLKLKLINVLMEK